VVAALRSTGVTRLGLAKPAELVEHAALRAALAETTSCRSPSAARKPQTANEALHHSTSTLHTPHPRLGLSYGPTAH